MRQFTTLIIIASVIIQTISQTIYVDYDTGKVLGVDEGKLVSQNLPQQNHPQQNWRHHHQQQVPNINYHPRRNNQNNIPENNNNAKWVCVNSVTGQSMIIDTVNNAARPGQNLNPTIENPYQDNPWLNKLQIPQPNDKPQPTIPSRQNIQETLAPVIQPTQPPTTSTTVPEIDWTKYLDVTTKKPAINLKTAIDGEGILQPRIFER